MWMSVKHKEKKALDIWAREIASAGTGMAPGLSALVGGRPKPSPCLKLFSFLYPKSMLPATIQLDDQQIEYLWCEIFGFFSSRSFKPREKCISFAQFAQFLNDRIHNYYAKKTINSKFENFPQKIYKLSKTNTFFSRFEATRGEKTKYFAPKILTNPSK